MIWVWNLVPHIKGRIQAEGVREQGPEEDHCAKGGESEWRTDIIARSAAS